MKRDMDLVRDILQRVEDADGRLSLSDFSFDDRTINEVGYHLDLLIHQGFLDGSVKYAYGGDCALASIKGLTWDGHDFLEATGNNEVWTRAKKVIKDTVGTTTFQVIKATCERVAESLILSSL